MSKVQSCPQSAGRRPDELSHGGMAKQRAISANVRLLPQLAARTKIPVLRLGGMAKFLLALMAVGVAALIAALVFAAFTL
jgi:hypothetical protein